MLNQARNFMINGNLFIYLFIYLSIYLFIYSLFVVDLQLMKKPSTIKTAMYIYTC